jgi:hypothetical protein
MKLRNVKRLGGGETMILYCAELDESYEGRVVEFCAYIPHVPFTARVRMVGAREFPSSPSVKSEIYKIYNAIERWFKVGCNEELQ